MNLVKTFIFASKSHVPDYYIDQKGNSFKLITDHLGSIRLVINASTGEVVQKMLHDEFGKVLINTKPNATPFGFAGGLFDSETGFVRFGARDYDPQTGRWTSKDLIRFEAGDSNLFGYVENDPINWIDINGLVKKDISDPMGGGGSGGGVSIPRGEGRTGRPFNPNQQSLVELAKQGQKTGVTRCEANQLVKWAKEYNLPGNPRVDPPHGGNTNYPHAHIGPINHIPIVD